MSGIITAKVKAVTPDPQPLISFLEAYVFREQYVIDQIWDLEHIPGRGRLHKMFYHRLKGLASEPITTIRSSEEPRR